MTLKMGDWNGHGDDPHLNSKDTQPPLMSPALQDETSDDRADPRMAAADTSPPADTSPAADTPDSAWTSFADQASDLQDHTLEALITMRDRFLSECFDIESGRRFVIDEADAESRLSVLRQRIDEIHEEMAQWDMTSEGCRTSTQRRADREPTPVAAPTPSRPPAAVPEKQAPAAPALKASPCSPTDDFLTRMEKRITALDALAEKAEANGAIADALQCLLAAQKLDQERCEIMSVIRT